MATVTVTRCSGGGHIHLAITTARGVVHKTVETRDLLELPDRETLVDKFLLANIRIRAIKAGAVNAAGIVAAVDGTTFQEI